MARCARGDRVLRRRHAARCAQGVIRRIKTGSKFTRRLYPAAPMPARPRPLPTPPPRSSPRRARGRWRPFAARRARVQRNLERRATRTPPPSRALRPPRRPSFTRAPPSQIRRADDADVGQPAVILALSFSRSASVSISTATPRAAAMLRSTLSRRRNSCARRRAARAPAAAAVASTTSSPSVAPPKSLAASRSGRLDSALADRLGGAGEADGRAAESRRVAAACGRPRLSSSPPSPLRAAESIVAERRPNLEHFGARSVARAARRGGPRSKASWRRAPPYAHSHSRWPSPPTAESERETNHGGGAIDALVQQLMRAREVGGTEGVDIPKAVVTDEAEPL